jgi:hypothetical protein
MSRLTIDTGTAGNPATGDSLRTAFNKVNTNFAELYSELGGDSLDAISFNNNTISTDITNANLILDRQRHWWCGHRGHRDNRQHSQRSDHQQ